jgi:pimeloyl-ACP methyl ester carboxylesterase
MARVAADAQLAVTETGRGPAALLVHGWTGFKESWGALPEALAAAGMRVVAVDLPGWGASRAGRGQRHDVLAYADALAPLVTRLAPVALVGHSLGAGPALVLAAREPARVSRLALIAPVGVPERVGWPPQSPFEAFALPILGRPLCWAACAALRHSRTRCFEGYRSAVADPERLERDPQLVALADSACKRLRRTSVRALAASLGAVVRADLRPLAAQIDQPALVVIGERDRVVHPGAAASLARNLRGARLLRVADAAHLPHIERPDVVCGAIAAHLAPRP